MQALYGHARESMLAAARPDSGFRTAAMTSSTSEPVVTPSTLSGLSPQALHDRHAARQRAMDEGHRINRRPALRRLRRLSDSQRAVQPTLFTPEDPTTPSSGQDPACKSKTAKSGTSAELKTLAPPQHSGAAPSRQQAPSGKAVPRYAGEKGAPAKHRQRTDAPRHLADPLSSKPVGPRKRSISEVLNMFKGKVSQAMAQRKHLKPARLDVSGREMTTHRLRNFDEDVATGWAAAADDPAENAGGLVYREHAAGCKAETPRDEHPRFQDNRQDLDLQRELAHLPQEDIAEVDQPVRCKAPQAPHSAGAGQQHAVRGTVHTCASTAECSPVNQAAPQERQPLARMPAVPPEKYAQHLKSFLLHRFCQASGLSEDQAGHPETVQQGIASLVSALQCDVTKGRAAGTTSKTEMQHASTGAMRTSAARSKSRQHVPAPSRLHSSKAKQQMYKTVLPVLSQRRAPSDPPFCSSNPTKLRGRGLPQGVGAGALSQGQQRNAESAVMGSKGVSQSLAGEVSEAGLPALVAPNLGPDNCPEEWMDSIHNPGSYLDTLRCEDDQDGMRCMHSSSPELLLTGDADVAGMSPNAHTLGSLPSSSPKLADALQQYAADSLERELQNAHICLDAGFEQACANDTRTAPEGDYFFHMTSKGAEAQLVASGRSDLQQLRMHQEVRHEASGLCGRRDAWLRDPADLQGSSSDLVSEFDAVFDKDIDEPEPRGKYGNLHVRSSGKSRQGTFIEADADPVAAFTGFCESLAM